MGYDADDAQVAWDAMTYEQKRKAVQDVDQYMGERKALKPSDYGVAGGDFDGDFDRTLARDAERRLCSEAMRNPSSRKEQILARMRALEAEFAELEKLPDEPQAANGPLIIHFIKRFTGSDTEYHYAFIKNPASGRWSGTGPKAPKEYTWDELVHWLNSTGPFPIIYKVGGLVEYHVPEDAE